MKCLWIASFLLSTAALAPAQVSTQYLDFGPTGSVSTTARDASGNLYVVGNHSDATTQFGIRVFKVSPSGSILYQFEFGGSNLYYIRAAVVDNSAALYIAGYMGNPGGANGYAGFPSVHPLLPYLPSTNLAGFVSKVDPTGTRLLFSTLLGGKSRPTTQSSFTTIGGIALDSSGNVYIAGDTTAPDFPITSNVYQKTGPTVTGLNPIYSAFVMKIAATLDQIVYSTFLSGNPNFGAGAGAIAVDAAGVATVAGVVAEYSGFPTTPGAYLQSPACCAFVTRLSVDGSSLLWSTMVHGLLGPRWLSLDAAGNVLFAGVSDSGYPTTPGALQTSAPRPSQGVGYLTKLSADGSTLIASTFLGTAMIAALTQDAQGNVWVAGSCDSSGLLDFPETPVAASSFFAEISPNLDRLMKSDLMPGYLEMGIAPTAGGGTMLVGVTGALLLLPSGFESNPAVLDVSNSAATIYWTPGIFSDTAPFGPPAWQDVSPGAFVSIYGRNLGPSNGLGAYYDRPGHIGTSLGGLTVSFDGKPASLLYAGSGQVNAIVPFEVAGQSSTVMRVETGTGFSQSVTLPVLASTPFIFSTPEVYSSSAAGTLPQPFASALNEDGTINSASNPATGGSVMSIFANGAGMYKQALADGTVNGSDLDTPVLPVSISFENDKQPLELLYAGTAPGLAAGVLQVNFRPPARINVLAGTRVDTVVLTVGSYQSQPVNIYTFR